MLGLGHDVVDVPAFAEQLGEPGSRMRNLFSMRELWQTAQRVQVKRDGEAVHLAARWAGKEAFLKAWCEAISRRANADGQGGCRRWVEVWKQSDGKLIWHSHNNNRIFVAWLSASS